MYRLLSRPLLSARTTICASRTVPTVSLSLSRNYSSELDPSKSKDYDAYVNQWLDHFRKVEDDFELERGLNHIFAADWVPSVEVVQEALQASRRLNTFATSVRILEALETKCDNNSDYSKYLTVLKPTLEELGVPERKELGEFNTVRDKNKWWY